MALDSRGAIGFNYEEFKNRLFGENFTNDQTGPLGLRLDLLESFMEVDLVQAAPSSGKPYNPSKPPSKYNVKPGMTKKLNTSGPELLSGKAGELKIIDLTDPVIDSDSACVLFDICLAIFLEKTDCGKVVALDEAHNVS
jgi:hypothetical protein